MTTPMRLGGVRRASSPTDGDAILQHLSDFLDAFMWQANPRTLEITFITDGVGEILEHSADAWLGEPKHWSKNIEAEDRRRVIACLRATAADGRDRDVEFRARAADGRTLTLRHAVRLITPPSGENELWGITTDVTGTNRTAEALRRTRDRYVALSAEAAEFKRQALEDPLTRLPNRVLFEDRLGTALRSARRSGDQFAVLVMDLDRFKELNDTHGHKAGDAALQEIALRFRICLRGQDTPARIGGDEFAAVLPNTDEAGAVRVARRICNALRDPLLIEAASHALGASIGVAIFPAHGSDEPELLAGADVAMYRAKATGGGYAVAVVDGSMPSRTPRPRTGRWVARRAVILSAAAIAIVSGALAPIAQRIEPRLDPAARLSTAASFLQNASNEDAGEMFTGVEQALAEIPWQDVAGSDMAAALDGLERTLHGLRSDIVGTLGTRIEDLIARIQQAEAVARLSEGSRTPGVPKILVKEPPLTVRAARAPARPTSVAAPQAVASPASPMLP